MSVSRNKCGTKGQTKRNEKKKINMKHPGPQCKRNNTKYIYSHSHFNASVANGINLQTNKNRTEKRYCFPGMRDFSFFARKIGP